MKDSRSLVCGDSSLAAEALVLTATPVPGMVSAIICMIMCHLLPVVDRQDHSGHPLLLQRQGDPLASDS